MQEIKNYKKDSTSEMLSVLKYYVLNHQLELCFLFTLKDIISYGG